MNEKETQYNSTKAVTTEEVRNFWQANPLSSNGILHELGSQEFFKEYNKQREVIESIEYSYQLHEYVNFKNKKVLDVGCGNGYVLSKYALEGADVFGIDITQAGVDLCNPQTPDRA